MTYEAPRFCEVKMDAEIGSYQNDFDDRGDHAPAGVTAEAQGAGSERVAGAPET
ncbi:hypothetical protein [Chondromyces apiculatus]|uniref:Coenzyme PQQ synthesis protein A n=1 Tax=Chondromyces apiculatus DSM 436 TaxID=1192034 RepID=A0A017TAR6_9BACT|nr:hypothetical protein [Chondromyces apiculatus]EYF05701.1 Hypothetical protein CAP_2991 [Chondromyces apiculatus DSM 436]